MFVQMNRAWEDLEKLVAISSRCRRGGLLYFSKPNRKEMKTMLKVYFRYTRYALTILATVGFGMSRN